jgi:Histidine kinase-like ATPase domain
MNTLVITIRADPCELSGFRHRLRAWLAASELPEDLQGSTVLAVHEVMAATIEHGPPDATIAIRASIDARVIRVDVTGGKWHPKHNGDARRLSLIQRLFEKVEVRPDPSGTTISLRSPRS